MGPMKRIGYVDGWRKGGAGIWVSGVEIGSALARRSPTQRVQAEISKKVSRSYLISGLIKLILRDKAH